MLAAPPVADVLVPQGTQIRTASITDPAVFQLLGDVVIPAGASPPIATGTIEHSAPQDELFASTGLPNQEVVLPATPYLHGSGKCPPATASTPRWRLELGCRGLTPRASSGGERSKLLSSDRFGTEALEHGVQTCHADERWSCDLHADGSPRGIEVDLQPAAGFAGRCDGDTALTRQVQVRREGLAVAEGDFEVALSHVEGSLGGDFVGGDDNQRMHHFVGFDNHFPVRPAMSGLDDDTTTHDVLAKGRGCLEHRTEVHLVEPAIVHALLEVRG